MGPRSKRNVSLGSNARDVCLLPLLLPRKEVALRPSLHT